MTKYGYIRVSTSEQSHDRQVDGLLPLCDELHIETGSAVGRKRPVYQALVRRLKPGDAVIVLSIDRAFRSTLDAIIEAEKFRKRSVSFQIVNLKIDTATPEGMYVYQIQAAGFEFERAFLIKRTREGLAAARRRGRRLGRPPKLNCEQLENARVQLAAPGATVTSVAKALGVWPWTLSRSLKRATIEQ